MYGNAGHFSPISKLQQAALDFKNSFIIIVVIIIIIIIIILIIIIIIIII